jgi:hypothetical protein
VKNKGTIVIPPGAFALLTTLEKIKFSNRFVSHIGSSCQGKKMRRNESRLGEKMEKAIPRVQLFFSLKKRTKALRFFPFVFKKELGGH